MMEDTNENKPLSGKERAILFRMKKKDSDGWVDYRAKENARCKVAKEKRMEKMTEADKEVFRQKQAERARRYIFHHSCI